MTLGRSCKSETDQMARPWAQALDRGGQELHHNVLAITLANKLTRIAWNVHKSAKSRSRSVLVLVIGKGDMYH